MHKVENCRRKRGKMSFNCFVRKKWCNRRFVLFHLHHFVQMS